MPREAFPSWRRTAFPLKITRQGYPAHHSRLGKQALGIYPQITPARTSFFGLRNPANHMLAAIFRSIPSSITHRACRASDGFTSVELRSADGEPTIPCWAVPLTTFDIRFSACCYHCKSLNLCLSLSPRLDCSQHMSDSC